ncbi:MAG TPA: GNAT family protein [Micromonosporaceae bacterium]|nr:GNAT family protein [Micromonosporaceae bacterium]
MRTLPRGPIPGRTVTLRDLTLDDIDGVVDACNDLQTQRFLGRLPQPYTPDDARDWITNQIPSGWAAGQAGFAVTLTGDDRIAGSVGLGVPTADGHATSIGYWVAPWARGRGVATDATRTLADWAFAQGFGRIELLTCPANAASMRVALGAGFTHEGVRRAAALDRGGWTDMIVWVRLASDSGVPAPRALPDLPDGSLTDGVIRLTPVDESDADAMYALASLPEVVATTVASRAPTPESVAHRCATAPYKWLIGERAECAIRDAITGAFAGDIGLFREAPTGQGLIGYSLVREWRGRHFATRAARLISDWAFDTAGLARLAAGTAPDNIASQRTLERAGFQREGYERGRLPSAGSTRVDNIPWAMLPGDRVVSPTRTTPR